MGQVFTLYMFSIGNKRCMMLLIINLLAFKHLGLVPNATGASGAEGVVLLLNCDLFEKQNCCLFQVFLDHSMFIFCILIFNFRVENLGAGLPSLAVHQGYVAKKDVNLHHWRNCQVLGCLHWGHVQVQTLGGDRSGGCSLSYAVAHITRSQHVEDRMFFQSTLHPLSVPCGICMESF